ncbi:MAG: tRNA (N6-isopentenyl adenosine(37)-C2)-methylthiotransferase MiaB [Pseudomonadota bacterium]|nr:tRNA (N6-isopentenyl adenosine(37)-C2)-methylthiotransferase MiaB [Pseudomonadota bacterium]
MSKQLYIKTFGCQMNTYDSRRIVDVMRGSNYEVADNPNDAELLIINTCHIREKAAEKLYSELGRLGHLKENRKSLGLDTTIVVAGCVAQAEGQEVRNRMPFVDIVVGPQTYHRLPNLITETKQNGKYHRPKSGIIDIEFPKRPKFDYLPKAVATGSSAFISVQEGCDKFCTFCVVPYTRGPEYSRPGDDVIREAQQLVEGGIKEITLLGQNVNAYHGAYNSEKNGNFGLGELLKELSKISGLKILRYTTSHPADMNNGLIDAHKVLDKLAPFLHLPVQSGSDRVLQRMNRGYKIVDYMRTLERLFDARETLKLSSDFIVGFPGETEKDFHKTLQLIKDVGFIQSFSFKYSARPGTPGSLMEDQVPTQVKNERLAEIQTLLASNQEKFNNACIGSSMSVLLDRPGRKPGQLAGRSPFMQAVHVIAPDSEVGKVVRLKVDDAFVHSLTGTVTKQDKNVHLKPKEIVYEPEFSRLGHLDSCQ